MSDSSNGRDLAPQWRRAWVVQSVEIDGNCVITEQQKHQVSLSLCSSVAAACSTVVGPSVPGLQLSTVDHVALDADGRHVSHLAHRHA